MWWCVGWLFVLVCWMVICVMLGYYILYYIIIYYYILLLYTILFSSSSIFHSSSIPPHPLLQIYSPLSLLLFFHSQSSIIPIIHSIPVDTYLCLLIFFPHIFFFPIPHSQSQIFLTSHVLSDGREMGVVVNTGNHVLGFERLRLCGWGVLLC